MNDYRILALRYLKQNKRRSLITIGGTALTVLLLYTMLNLGWSYLLSYRQELREEQDYEIVFLTETHEQITAILADDRIQSAYVGQYYWYHNREGIMYENALYVNTNQPYRMNAIQEQLCTAYEVDADMNDILAWTYLQGSDGNLMAIIILFVLLVSFIFAIFGVGLIRNSIQLCMLENIKDYGNLRCIGSSKGQLKSIIYLQGMVLEVIGILCGTILGVIVSLILGAILNQSLGTSMHAGFHMLPLVLVLVVFLGALYFVMNENCKLVTKMTPMSAIRGEYRIRQEKIKNHSHNIIGRIFGVDADYAYKSIMRNPGRFYRTVGALVFGIAASICILGLFHSIQSIQTERLAAYQKYQDATCTEEQWNMATAVECYGYSESAIARYQSVLTDGTLNLSQHGNLLVNQASLVSDNPSVNDYTYDDYTLTDYQVGDTIELVDMEELNQRVQEELDDLMDDYKAKLEVAENSYEEASVESWYSQQKAQMIQKHTSDLLAEGKVVTYTIEGIVSQDVNLYRSDLMEAQALRIIMSQDSQYSFL